MNVSYISDTISDDIILPTDYKQEKYKWDPKNFIIDLQKDFI